MIIPDNYLSEESLRRLFQMAEKILGQCGFPQSRYDDDIASLMEDVVQETLSRIHEMDEPEETIRNWPGFMYRVMQFVIFEERRAAYRPKNSGWERMSGQGGLDVDDGEAPEESVPDPTTPVTEALEIAEMLSIICEEGEKIFEYPGFASFVDLVWRQGYSRNAAWNEIKDSCRGLSKATFFRRFELLRKAVDNRLAT
jgi:DNA-directed RNA polymerase specialized sigma24 family protein